MNINFNKEITPIQEGDIIIFTKNNYEYKYTLLVCSGYENEEDVYHLINLETCIVWENIIQEDGKIEEFLSERGTILKVFNHNDIEINLG